MPEAPGFGGYDSLFTFSKSMQDEMTKEYNAKWTPEQRKRPTKEDIIFKAPSGYDDHLDHFTNFFDSGNNLNITTPTSITSAGKQPDYWITEGNIYAPLKLKGSGSPEGVLAANVGTTYIDLNGGVGSTFYVKETGTGNTGWAAK